MTALHESISGDMRVTHVSTLDGRGGAARSAFRLHTGLRQLGVESTFFVRQQFSTDPTVRRFVPPLDWTARLKRRLRHETITRSFDRYRQSRPAGFELFTDDRCQHGSDPVRQLPKGDLVNLHWVAGTVDYPAFFRTVPLERPVVWTLHDMNAFTGGCHYDMGCGKYATQCGACPQLGSGKQHDLANAIWQRKRHLFAGVAPATLRFVAPSRWLANEAKRSLLGELFQVQVIPYGIDLGVFRPVDRLEARQRLRIDSNAKVVLFVAEDTGNRRKGYSLLAAALGQLESCPGVQFVTIGQGRPAAPGGIPTLNLGSFDDDSRLALVYSAADLFVVPSIQDNLPNTVLESIACGTPVVGFNVGGIPDMVRPGLTGELAPAGDIEALAQLIGGLLRDEARRSGMSAQCRAIAEREFDLLQQARTYANLYQELLADRARSAHQ